MALAACTEAQLGAHVAKQLTGSKHVGYFKVGNPYVIAGKRYYPRESYDLVETGIASWYGLQFHGRKTANGEVFDRMELTAAHRTLQLPSLVRVTNLENGRSLVVRVNDRGPYKRGRIIDLSEKAAELLDFKHKGTARVRLQVLNRESKAVAEAARRGIDTSGVEVAMNKGQPYPELTPQQSARIQPAAYDTASARPVEAQPLTSKDYSGPGGSGVQPVTGEPLPLSGHMERGVFMPDPVVSQLPVGPTSIYVQVGAFTVQDNALSLAARLNRFGDTKIYPVTLNGQQFYRVRIGPFQEVKQADDVLNRMVSAQFDNAIIVVD